MTDDAKTIEKFERLAKRHKDMWMRLTPIGLHLLHSTPTTSKHLTQIIPWSELKDPNTNIEERIGLSMDRMAKELS